MKVILIFILITPIVILTSILELFIMCLTLIFLLFRDKKVNKYIKNNFISIDQRLNTWVFGDMDETISSRLGKHVENKDCIIARWICNLLNIADKSHCKKTTENDEGKDAIFPF